MANKPSKRAPAKAKPSLAKAPAARKAKAAKKAKPAPRRAAPKRGQPASLRITEMSVGMTVDDLQRSMRFWIDGLGFTIKERWEREGVLRGVMLKAGTCEIALGQDDWAKGRDRAKGVAIRMYAETGQDIDALARRVSKAGIAVDGPKTASWGARTMSVTDPDGFQITFHERS